MSDNDYIQEGSYSSHRVKKIILNQEGSRNDTKL